ncbi:hypothetical protein EJ03DRAFT_339502 [Teratosphaeria nubilosa]|uniref:C2H2-type domain-containing protein n=1 Tax=Teratosphaeria nubilosa TaxID=161662 RepID=A0A6G1KX49_9PEZI|nr:hypothetical protein EJ03DRAFT_339502 [Teratosphaeria nubilosa]
MSTRVSARKGDTKNQRYVLPPGEEPYICCLCSKTFSSRWSCKRHFQQTCHKAHGSPQTLQWDDHPSCLTPVAAQESGVGRPFYPYTAGANGEKILSWPRGTNWPKNEAELLRQNAVYKATPGVCKWYYDWADAARTHDEHLDVFCPVENAIVQLEALLDVVTPRTMKLLLSAAETSAGREDGFQDDVLLAVVLHSDVRDVVDSGLWTYYLHHRETHPGKPRTSELQPTPNSLVRQI